MKSQPDWADRRGASSGLAPGFASLVGDDSELAASNIPHIWI